MCSPARQATRQACDTITRQGLGGSGRYGGTGVRTARADSPAGGGQGLCSSDRFGGVGVCTARADSPAGESLQLWGWRGPQRD